MPDIRDVALRDVWGRNAQTTIPAPPVSGVAYRNANVADFGEGQRFDAVFDSARWNQLLYETTSIVRLAEQYGGIPWSPLTAYPIGSRAMGSNGEIYQAIRASTPASPQNPIGASTYWASIKTDPAIATTTTSGIARQATEAEAVAGSASGAVFVTPYTSNRSNYLASYTAVTNATASGAHFHIANNAIVTLDDAVDVGKYFIVMSDGVATFQPGQNSLVQIRGGQIVSGTNNSPVTVPVSGFWGILIRISTVYWRLLFTPNIDNAITSRLATDAEALSMNDVSKIPTLRTGAITRIIGASSGAVLDIATIPVGSAIELGGVDRVLLISAGDIPNGAEFRIHAYEGSVIRVPTGVNLYGRGSVGWNNTLIVGGGDWTSQYKMAGVLRKASSTQWTLIANYQYGPTDMTPVGCVDYFAMATAPAGYLKANGAAVSRTTYAALFTAIGTVYGVGNGSTTFNLPDLRGEFIRGWDDARGVDAGRVLGSAQGDAIRNITGGVVGTYSNGSQGTGATGAFAYEAQGGYIEAGAGSRENYVSFSASRVVPTAAENRPRNVALLACIKY